MRELRTKLYKLIEKKYKAGALPVPKGNSHVKFLLNSVPWLLGEECTYSLIYMAYYILSFAGRCESVVASTFNPEDPAETIKKLIDIFSVI